MEQLLRDSMSTTKTSLHLCQLTESLFAKKKGLTNYIELNKINILVGLRKWDFCYQQVELEKSGTSPVSEMTSAVFLVSVML